jgi:predicted HTH domain antitoxin
MATTIQIPIPESFRAVLGERAPDEAKLARWSYEALVIEAYREGLITRGKIGELLNLPFHEREAWLKERDVPYLYDASDLEDDKRVLDKLFGR